MTPIEVPVTSTKRRRRRIRRFYQVAIGVLVALALAGVGLVVNDYRSDLVQQRQAAAQHCPGLDATAGEGFELFKTGEQCVGWIVEHDYPFGSTDPAVVSIISKIITENQRVREQSGNADGKPYVRVGVLIPMTSASGSALTANEILHALQGAYAAQIYANRPPSPTTELGDTTPLIQLVLANEGLDESLWPGVVDQLGRLKDGDHPLVAVTGLGISIPATREAAKKLSELEIPTIGAALTANDMVAPWLFQMSPSTHQAAQSLKAFLSEQPGARTGYLVYDRNPEDNFVRSLEKAFTETFDSVYELTKHSSGFNGSIPPTAGTPILFSEIVRDVCALEPDLVFYAGRGRDLPALVRALEGRGRCQNPVRPLVIVGEGIGLVVTPEELNRAQIGLVRALSINTESWRTGEPGTPTHYNSFHALFTTAVDKGGLGFAEEDLYGGYAIMHRDAVAAAVWAARRDARAKENRNIEQGTSAPGSDLPTSRDVRNALFSSERDPIPGASGDFYFKELPPNDRWPSGKPVPVIRIGAIVEQWTSPNTYVTE